MSDACVLDTYPWLHLIEDTGVMPRRAQRLIAGGITLHVPAMCLWEVAMLIERDRVTIADPRMSAERWMRAALAAPCEVAPLTPRIAACSAELGRERFHGDPADRMVYATARVMDLPLITADEKIHAYEAGLPRRTRRLAVWD